MNTIDEGTTVASASGRRRTRLIALASSILVLSIGAIGICQTMNSDKLKGRHLQETDSCEEVICPMEMPDKSDRARYSWLLYRKALCNCEDSDNNENNEEDKKISTDIGDSNETKDQNDSDNTKDQNDLAVDCALIGRKADREECEKVLAGTSGNVIAPTKPVTEPPINSASESKSYDAIVVGAGWAGVAAAATLKDEGYDNILVLEARNRIGGRSHTDKNFLPDDIPIEIGSEYLYTAWDNVIVDAFDDENVAYDVVENNFVTFTSEGMLEQELTEELDSSLWKNGFLPYSEKASREEDADYDTMLSQYERDEGITNNFEQQFLEMNVNSYVSIEYGADGSELSTKETLDWLGCTDNEMAVSSVPDGGFGPAIENFADDKSVLDNVQLNAIVKDINYDGDDVTVTYNQGGSSITAKAPAVIVTAPLGVLKARSINFSPSLPSSNLDAINNAQFGTLDKIFLYWDKESVETNPQFASAWDNIMGNDWLEVVTEETETSGDWTAFFNARSYNDLYTITGWIAGSQAEAMEKLSDDDVLEAAMENVRKIFGSSIPLPTKHRMTRWAQDEFARGAYSFPYVGQSFSALANMLKEPVSDKLFFAGEHTSTEWAATAVGAFETGVEAASRVAKVIGR